MYLDTAVIIKLLGNELDSARFQDLPRGHCLSTTELAFTEVCSALLAKERNGQISQNDRNATRGVFEGQLNSGQIAALPLNGIAIRKADAVLARCQPDVPLFTLDAIHMDARDLPRTSLSARRTAACAALPQNSMIPIFPPTSPRDV